MHQSKLCLVTLHRLSKDSGSRRLSSLSSFEDSTVSGHMIRIRSFGSLEDSVASVLPDSVFERLASSKTVSTTLKFESIEGNGYKKIIRCKKLSHECSVWYNIVAAWDEDIQNKSVEDKSSSYEMSMFAWNPRIQFTNCYEHLDDCESSYRVDFNK